MKLDKKTKVALILLFVTIAIVAITGIISHPPQCFPDSLRMNCRSGSGWPLMWNMIIDGRRVWLVVIANFFINVAMVWGSLLIVAEGVKYFRNK